MEEIEFTMMDPMTKEIKNFSIINVSERLKEKFPDEFKIYEKNQKLNPKKIMEPNERIDLASKIHSVAFMNELRAAYKQLMEDLNAFSSVYAK